MRKLLLLIFLSFGVAGGVFAQGSYTADWSSLDARPVPQWFKDAKLGIFIHWGVYSVPAWAPVGKDYAVYSKYSEWYWNRLVTDSSKVGQAFRAYHTKTYGPHFMYQDFAPMFKAELFNPGQWAEIFKNSGAQYVVLTSKHHDGFALWPSAQSWNWNAADVGPHRDLAGELSDAVKAKGLHMGFYYSLYEWFNPLYKSDFPKYVSEHMMPQLKDLVTRYRPDVVWPDGEWEHPSEDWKSKEFLAWLYNESPVRNTVVVNDRWGKETRSKHGGYYTTEYDIVHDEDASKKKFEHPWEECRGIGGSFGYNRNESLGDYETSDAVIHMLIQKVARGGNLLLDIGPAADGSIPVIMQQRLADLGAWLGVNGEAIYGTTVGPLVEGEGGGLRAGGLRAGEGSGSGAGGGDGAAGGRDVGPRAGEGVFVTKKDKAVYLIITSAREGTVAVNLERAPVKVSLLGGADRKIGYRFSKGKCIVDVKGLYPNLPSGGYAWVVKISIG